MIDRGQMIGIQRLDHLTWRKLPIEAEILGLRIGSHCIPHRDFAIFLQDMGLTGAQHSSSCNLRSLVPGWLMDWAWMSADECNLAQERWPLRYRSSLLLWRFCCIASSNQANNTGRDSMGQVRSFLLMREDSNSRLTKRFRSLSFPSSYLLYIAVRFIRSSSSDEI